MSRFTGLLLGVWDFVVGDDWQTALGVVLALALTAAVARTISSDWWIMALAVAGLLALSVRRAGD